MASDTIMHPWKLHEAKARFSELLDTTLKKGPQVISRRGKDTAVLVAVEEWRRLQQTAQPTLKSLLLGEGPRFEDLARPRGRLRRRRLPTLS